MPQVDASCGHDDSTMWERVAETTRWGAYVSDVEKRAILEAHGLVEMPSTALEIGAEGGRWSKMLADLGWTMICTDINDKMVARCQERIPAAECILVRPDDNELPCASEVLDLLLCIEVPPVITADWFPSEASRVLKPDGLLVGVFWNFLSLRGLFVHARDRSRGEIDYYKLSYPFWRRKLSDRGYSILYEEGYCWFPFGRASNSAFVPYFVAMERWLRLRKLPVVSPWIMFIAQKSSSGHSPNPGRFS